MRVETFRDWLARYGDAWEQADPEGAGALFAPAASFRATPFAAEARGSGAIRDLWGSLVPAGARVFTAEVLGVGEAYGLAHWRATARDPAERDTPGSVTTEDGILLAAFDPRGRCTSLRRWVHQEAGA